MRNSNGQTSVLSMLEPADQGDVAPGSVLSMATQAVLDASAAEADARPARDPRFQLLSVFDIIRSQFNPRRHFDEAALAELADSIKEHGVLEPILVRRFPEARQVAALTVHYEILAGERRWRAAKDAGISLIPAIVRECDDREALEIALVENLIRRDIDPIEAAGGYKQMIDMGYTQEEISSKIGRSRPAIANALRLLQLPEDVQEMIRTGRLTVAHGVNLCRYADHPAFVSGYAAWIVEKKHPSKHIEKQIVDTQVLAGRGLLRQLRSWTSRFDFATICPNCPLGAYFENGGDPVCLNDAHWRKLQDGALEREREQLREKAARNMADRSQSAPAPAADLAPLVMAPIAPISTDPDPGDVADVEVPPAPQGLPSAASAETAAEPEPLPVPAPIAEQISLMPLLKDMDYGEYNHIHADASEECRKSCPCRMEAINNVGEIVTVCSNPDRYMELAQKGKAEQERRDRETVTALAAAAAPLLEAVSAAHEGGAPCVSHLPAGALDTRRVAIVAVWSAICRAAENDTVLSAAAKACGIEIETARLRRAISPGDYDGRQVLLSYPVPLILRFAAEISIRCELEDAMKWGGHYLNQTTFLLGRTAPAAPDVSDDEEEESEPGQDEEKVDTSPDEPDGEILCSVCLEVNGFESDFDKIGCERLPGRWRAADGALFTDEGEYFCPACAPDARICRVCGCTDNAGCPEGCSWIEGEHNLCSACWEADPVRIPEPPAADPSPIPVPASTLSEWYRNSNSSGTITVIRANAVSKIYKPFDFQGRLYTVTGSVWKGANLLELSAYELIPDGEWIETSYTYTQKFALPDPRAYPGGYHGIRVLYGQIAYVLKGPEITFVPDRICRVCGCTDITAGEGWVVGEADLCYACRNEAKTDNVSRETIPDPADVPTVTTDLSYAEPIPRQGPNDPVPGAPRIREKIAFDMALFEFATAARRAGLDTRGDDDNLDQYKLACLHNEILRGIASDRPLMTTERLVLALAKLPEFVKAEQEAICKL
jgi:ParB family chromosome partitioning protein